MNRPCDKCTVNITEVVLYGEVTCYLTCKGFSSWRAVEDGRVGGFVDQTKEDRRKSS